MNRPEPLAVLLCLAFGCGGSTPKERALTTGVTTVPSALGRPSATPSSSAAPDTGVTTWTTPSKDELEKQQLVKQLEDAKNLEQRAEDARKLKEDKSKPHTTASGEPKGSKEACKCAAADPLCSCQDAAPPIQGDQDLSGKKKPKAFVHAASTGSMTGRLTPEQVERAVRDGIDRFAGCTNGEAVVTLHAVISAAGKVADASSVRSVPDDARLRDCVVAGFKGIQFPANTDGQSVPIEFDLALSPAS